MTAELATFVASQLGGDRVRAMFGGWGIYLHGEMIGVHLPQRKTEAAQARFVAAGMRPFRPRPQRTIESFWEIPPKVLHDADELARWSRQSD